MPPQTDVVDGLFISGFIIGQNSNQIFLSSDTSQRKFSNPTDRDAKDLFLVLGSNGIQNPNIFLTSVEEVTYHVSTSNLAFPNEGDDIVLILLLKQP